MAPQYQTVRGFDYDPTGIRCEPGDEVPEELPDEVIGTLLDMGAIEAVADPVPLEQRTRAELDQLAADLGVPDPGSMANKGEVIAAIEMRMAAEGGDGDVR